MTLTMPIQKPGKSRQDYGTPPPLVGAVVERFGPLAWDLAASGANHKAPRWFDETTNALAQDWHLLEGLLWLNPPFANIDPWAEKCRDEARRGARVLLLTPASIGANWFSRHVHGNALVLGLSPRLTFEGETQPYPKDCMLSCFGWPPGFDCWRWKP